MFKKTLVIAAFTAPFLLAPVFAQQPQVQRKVMLPPADLAAPGYQSAMVLVEIPAGAGRDDIRIRARFSAMSWKER